MTSYFSVTNWDHSKASLSGTFWSLSHQCLCKPPSPPCAWDLSHTAPFSLLSLSMFLYCQAVLYTWSHSAELVNKNAKGSQAWVSHFCNFSTWEVEGGGLGIDGQVKYEFHVNSDYEFAPDTAWSIVLHSQLCNTIITSYPRALGSSICTWGKMGSSSWQEGNMLPAVLRNVDVSGKHRGQRKDFGPGMASEVAAHVVLWYVQKMVVVWGRDFSNKEVMASRGSIHQRWWKLRVQ